MALISSGTMTLSGGPNITLNQTGNLVQISGAGAAGTVSMFPPQPEQLLYSATGPNFTTNTGNQTTYSAWVMPLANPAYLRFNNLRIPIVQTFSTASTSISSLSFRYFMGMSFGLYSLSSQSTLSLFESWTGSMEYSNGTAALAANGSILATVGYGGTSSTISTQGFLNHSNVINSVNGSKMVPLIWSTDTNTLPAGQFFAIVQMSSSMSTSPQANISQVGFASKTYSLPPEFVRLTTETLAGWPFLGLIQVTNSASLMPTTIHTSAFNSSATLAGLVNSSVWFQMNSN